MSDTQPGQLYRIKIKDYNDEVDAVRSRNTWNKPWTGSFVTYDQYVESASLVVWLMCANCEAPPFRVTQAEIDEAGGFINCECCDKPCTPHDGPMSWSPERKKWEFKAWK